MVLIHHDGCISKLDLNKHEDDND